MLQIQRRRFVELPQQLQRNRLAEQRRLMLGLARQHLVETGDGRLRLFLMQQANSQTQLRFLALRIDFERLLKRIRGFLPAAELLIADAQVEVRRGMPRRRV